MSSLHRFAIITTTRISFCRALPLLIAAIALSGCFWSRAPILDIAKGATDVPTGTFERTPDSAKVSLTQNGKLYVYIAGSDIPVIASFHPIGDSFYVASGVRFGRDKIFDKSMVAYGVLDARFKGKLVFSLLDCNDENLAFLKRPPQDATEEGCEIENRDELMTLARNLKAAMVDHPEQVNNLQTLLRTD